MSPKRINKPPSGDTVALYVRVSRVVKEKLDAIAAETDTSLALATERTLERGLALPRLPAGLQVAALRAELAEVARSVRRVIDILEPAREHYCRQCGALTCACADCWCTACSCPVHEWNAKPEKEPVRG